MADIPVKPAKVRLPALDATSLDDAPVPVQPRWFLRWEIMLPLIFVVIICGPIGGWFGIGVLAEWRFERFIAWLRTQGYSTEQSTYWPQKSSEWMAARNADPVLGNPTVRLAMYGAHVASLNPAPRDLETDLFAEQMVSELFAGLVEWMPNQASSIHHVSTELHTALEMRTAMLETLHQPADNVDPAADVNALLLTEDIKGTGIVLALWPARLDGVHDLYRAARWRYILGIDSAFSRQPWEGYDALESERSFVGSLSNMFLLQSYIYMDRGQADKVVALWEEIYRPPVLYAYIDKDPLLLSYGLRRGLFSAEQLQRLWNAPYPNADDLRDEAALHVQSSVATIYKARAMYKDFGKPDWRALRMITEPYSYGNPKPGKDPTLLDALPRKTRLMQVQALTQHWVDYVARLQAERGTQQWAEFPDMSQDAMLGKYLGNVARDYRISDRMTTMLVSINLRNALLAFGLYRARTGRLPDRLEDFMTPELSARIINCPRMVLAYGIDDQGIARIRYMSNLSCPPDKRFNGVTDVVVYHPEDAAAPTTPAAPPTLPAPKAAAEPSP